jgi:hypothetical protein
MSKERIHVAGCSPNNEPRNQDLPSMGGETGKRWAAVRDTTPQSYHVRSCSSSNVERCRGLFVVVSCILLTPTCKLAKDKKRDTSALMQQQSHTLSQSHGSSRILARRRLLAQQQGRIRTRDALPETRSATNGQAA